jgi:hypothetical protein
VFQPWALAHGSFLIAWPILTVVSYVAIVVLRHLARVWMHRHQGSQPNGLGL